MSLGDLVKRAINIPRPTARRRAPPSVSPENATGNSEAQRGRRRPRAAMSEAPHDPTEAADDPILAILEHCAGNEDEYQSVWHYLSVDLFKSCSESRLRTLNVVDALFHSSSRFRSIVNDSVETIARCGGVLKTMPAGARKADILPANASVVESRVLELLALWDHVYGNHFPQIHSLVRYLREGERIRMPNITARLSEMKLQREEERRVRRQKTLLRAGQVISRDLDEALHRARRCMDAIEQCLSILFPSPGEVPAPSEDGSGPHTLPTGDNDDTEGADVNWQTEEGEGVEEEGGVADRDPLAGAAPYTMEIVLGADGKEDEILNDTIREAVADLTQTLVPRLLHFRDILADAANERAQNPESTEASQSAAQMETIALRRTTDALLRARELLSQRCKALLAPAVDG